MIKEDTMADNYIDVTNLDFVEKVLDATEMVVVNFSAEWSSSCQILNPELEALSTEYQGRVTFAKLNVDENKGLTSQWEVDGIPTLIFFKGGQEINRIKGIIMREKLRRQIEGTLLHSGLSE